VAAQVWDSDGRQLNGPDLFAEDADDERRKRFLPTKRVLWALASTVDPAKCDHIMTVFEVHAPSHTTRHDTHTHTRTGNVC
jgi:hypothetical protein